MQKHVMGLLLRIVLVLLVSHFHLILVQLLIWFPELTDAGVARGGCVLQEVGR